MSFIEVQSAVRQSAKRQYTHASKVFQSAGVKWPIHAERGLYLAYGFLRGVPYRVMEPTAKPLFDTIGHASMAFLEQVATLIAWADKDQPKPTHAVMQAWLDQPEPEAHRTKRLAKEAAAKKARMERYAEHQKVLAAAKVA